MSTVRSVVMIIQLEEQALTCEIVADELGTHLTILGTSYEVDVAYTEALTAMVRRRPAGANLAFSSCSSNTKFAYTNITF